MFFSYRIFLLLLSFSNDSFFLLDLLGPTDGLVRSLAWRLILFLLALVLLALRRRNRKRWILQEWEGLECRNHEKSRVKAVIVRLIVGHVVGVLYKWIFTILLFEMMNFLSNELIITIKVRLGFNRKTLINIQSINVLSTVENSIGLYSLPFYYCLLIF